MKFAKKRAREAEVEFESGKAKLYLFDAKMNNEEVNIDLIKKDTKLGFVVPEKSVYQKLHNNFMEKMKRGAQHKKIVFQEYIRRYLKKKLKDIGEEIIKSDTKEWACLIMYMKGNICRNLSTEIAIHLWNKEKILAFFHGVGDHTRLAVFVSNQFNEREMKIRTNWLILDMKLRVNDLMSGPVSMNVSQERLTKILEKELFTMGFEAFVEYQKPDRNRYDITLPKEYRYKEGLEVGNFLRIERTSRKFYIIPDLPPVIADENLRIESPELSIVKFINKEWLQENSK